MHGNIANVGPGREENIWLQESLVSDTRTHTHTESSEDCEHVCHGLEQLSRRLNVPAHHQFVACLKSEDHV